MEVFKEDIMCGFLKKGDRQQTKYLGSVGNFSQDNLQWFPLEKKFFISKTSK